MDYTKVQDQFRVLNVVRFCTVNAWQLGGAKSVFNAVVNSKPMLMFITIILLQMNDDNSLEVAPHPVILAGLPLYNGISNDGRQIGRMNDEYSIG